MLKALLLAFVLALPAIAAQAAVPEDWNGFRKEVEQKCHAAVEDFVETPRVLVDPFGSPNYGLAIIIGKYKRTEARLTYVCVVDKETQAVELGGGVDEDKLKLLLGK
jgi:hypothetical protein